LIDDIWELSREPLETLAMAGFQQPAAPGPGGEQSPSLGFPPGPDNQSVNDNEASM
jgi:hypothetical protein